MKRTIEKVDLGIEFHLSHVATPYFYENSAGIYSWHAELRVSDTASRSSGSVVIGTARMMCADTVDCDDFVVDMDWLGADLGEMADVVRQSLMEDGDGTLVRPNVRALFVTDVVLDPHWRGRGLGPAMVKIAARTLGAVDAVYLIPSALRSSRDDHGVWTTSYDAPRPGNAAQTKVRKAWKNAGFRRRLGTVYELLLGDDEAMAEAQLARRHLSAITFTQEDIEWWQRVGAGADLR